MNYKIPYLIIAYLVSGDLAILFSKGRILLSIVFFRNLAKSVKVSGIITLSF